MRICFIPLICAFSLHAASYQGHTVKSVVRQDASGRLVRNMVVAPRPVLAKVVPSEAPALQAVAAAAPGSMREMVDQIAAEHSVDPQLVHSVIRVESNYNPYAVSSKGALGVMQLVPGTAKRFGVSNVFNAEQNIQGGVRYLKYLLGLFDGNYPLALAAYNAGEAAVARYGGIPPYAETRSYVYQVGKRLGEARAAAERAKPAPVASRQPGEPNSIREVIEPDGSVRYVTR